MGDLDRVAREVRVERVLSTRGQSIRRFRFSDRNGGEAARWMIQDPALSDSDRNGGEADRAMGFALSSAGLGPADE
jgi:hypothetical protein